MENGSSGNETIEGGEQQETQWHPVYEDMQNDAFNPNSPEYPTNPNLPPDNDPNGVYARRGGVVTRSGWQDPEDHGKGFGWRTSIDTDDGYEDFYGHLKPESTPPVGTKVKAGDRIGEMGVPKTGSGTGSHVHVGRRRKSDLEWVNPGTQSPFGNTPSRITSEFNAKESFRKKKHGGVDHVPIYSQ